MARGRFINASIGSSRKFAALPDDTSRMVYMMLLANADALGRFDADPVIIAGRVLTRLDISAAQCRTVLHNLAQCGLVRLYVVNDNMYGEIVDFHRHNQIHAAREPASEIPDCRGVLPPDRPPRNTTLADANPLVFYKKYLQDGISAYEELVASGGAVFEVCGTVPHNAAQSPQKRHNTDRSEAKRSEVEAEVEVEVEENKTVDLTKNVKQAPSTLVVSANAESDGLTKKPEKEITKKKKRFNPREINLPPNWPNEAWQAWCDYRSSKRKPISEHAAKLTLKTFEHATPEEITAAVKKSIANDWQGLFKPKDNQRGTLAESQRTAAAIAAAIGYEGE